MMRVTKEEDDEGDDDDEDDENGDGDEDEDDQLICLSRVARHFQEYASNLTQVDLVLFSFLHSFSIVCHRSQAHNLQASLMLTSQSDAFHKSENPRNAVKTHKSF